MSLITIIDELEEQIDRIEETQQYIDFVDNVLPEELEEIRQTILRFAGTDPFFELQTRSEYSYS